ncbi:amino acid adenylation domain-containing protein [Salinarimonas sp.]|uniref:amino acid adenylation domain-containing protein n=1 Tax=Salinarimonas sp. TaxID=2766526 RepID=UPI0032D94948
MTSVFDGAEAIYGLTPMQETMLLYSDAAGAGAFVGQLACRLLGPLDAAALERAFEALLARHPALRTAFVSQGLERPLQVVAARVALPFRIVDWSGLPGDERSAREAAFLEEDVATRFAPDSAPLMRVALIRASDEDHLLVWTRHHVLMDGWSMALAIDELAALYAAERDGRPADLRPARPFQDYVDWLDRRDRSQDLDFWRSALSSAASPTPMVPADPAPKAAEAPLVEHARPLAEAAADAVRRTAHARGITEAAVLAAAWALVVARHADSDDALFGLTASGRPADLAGVESTVGLFLNTVPLNVPLPPDRRVGPWLEEVADILAAASDHAHIALSDLRTLSPVPSEEPLFDHILVLEGASLAGSVDRFADLAVRDYRFIDQTNFALNVGVQLGSPKQILVVHDPGRIDGETACRIGTRFEAAIAAVTGDPDRTLGAIALVDEAHERFLAEVVNATRVEFTDRRSLLRRIADQDRAATALISEQGRVCYGALWDASGALAQEIAAAGVGPEDVVALVLERGPLLPLAVLATMRAGAVYLPLDPSDAPQRLADLIAESGAALVLATDPLAGLVSQAGARVRRLRADDLARSPSGDAPVPDPDPDAAAYAIFTSGSTGRPKAVVNTWDGLRNRIDWMQSAYPIGPGDRVLHKTPYTFDVSVWELIWPLTEGAAMVVAAPDGHRDPDYLRDLIVAEGVTLCHFVPSMLRAFLATPGIESCRSLARVICSGEALTGADRDRAHSRLSASVHNLYGPAEAAIDVSSHDCARDERSTEVPIGRPIANTRLYLLDRNLLPASPGATGEVFIAGRNLARGYLGRPGLTAERFLPDPFADEAGSRMYRTGDLARRLGDGSLVHAGRSDSQIKLRGMRIELGEIEAALRALDGVAEAAVTVGEAPDGGPRLVAHLVARPAPTSPDGAGLSPDDLIRRLEARLPKAMVPSAFVSHAALPLSPNGKLDRRALAAHAAQGPDKPRVAPRTEEERRIAAIWSEVLGTPDIGVTDDFFALGGHSLLLVQVAARLRQSFEIEISLRALFNARTVETMLDVVLDAELAGLDAEERAALLADLAPMEGRDRP